MKLHDNPDDRIQAAHFDKRNVSDDSLCNVYVGDKLIAEGILLTEASDLISARDRQRFSRPAHDGDVEILKRYKL